MTYIKTETPRFNFLLSKSVTFWRMSPSASIFFTRRQQGVWVKPTFLLKSAIEIVASFCITRNISRSNLSNFMDIISFFIIM